MGLETDKATFEIPAPEAGVLISVAKQAGQTAGIGETIAILEPGPKPDGGGAAPAKKHAAEAAPTPQPGMCCRPAAARPAFPAGSRHRCAGPAGAAPPSAPAIRRCRVRAPVLRSARRRQGRPPRIGECLREMVAASEMAGLTCASLQLSAFPAPPAGHLPWP
ncbi:MAG: biotin/lipoyl-containing protein [Burkholderiales bacterium]